MGVTRRARCSRTRWAKQALHIVERLASRPLASTAMSAGAARQTLQIPGKPRAQEESFGLVVRRICTST